MEDIEQVTIIVDGGDVFEGDIAQFEDCFGGVGSSIGGVVSFCADHGYALSTKKNGAVSRYIMWKESEKWFFDT